MNQNYLLRKMIMKAQRYILAKKKLLPPLPEPLSDNPNYEIDYVGRLSMATKSFEVMGAMQTLRMFGEVAQLDQRMLKTLDNVSPDKLFREVWYANSSSMNALKSLDEVVKEREVMNAIEQSALRVPVFSALKHLIITIII